MFYVANKWDNMAQCMVWIEFLIKALVETYCMLIIGITKNILWISLILLNWNFKLWFTLNIGSKFQLNMVDWPQIYFLSPYFQRYLVRIKGIKKATLYRINSTWFLIFESWRLQKPKRVRIEGGRWGSVGWGKVVVGKWRQLYLNNNKKIKNVEDYKKEWSVTSDRKHNLGA